MAVRLYMDQHVPSAITKGLRARGVDVITAYDDERSDAEDPSLLDRSTTLGRALFTRDNDFLVEAARRQNAGVSFVGVIFAHQLNVSIGRCISDLEVIAHAGRPDDVRNRVTHLPL